MLWGGCRFRTPAAPPIDGKVRRHKSMKVRSLNTLNAKLHYPEMHRIIRGRLGSAAGEEGAFSFTLDGLEFFCIASNGYDWEHVSVSLANRNRCPTWNQMCKIKAMFWPEDACVLQYHPAASEYVDLHPFCLHMWRPLAAEIPQPPKWMVG